MKPTEHNAKTPSTRTGFSALLRACCRNRGTGAPKTATSATFFAMPAFFKAQNGNEPIHNRESPDHINHPERAVFALLRMGVERRESRSPTPPAPRTVSLDTLLAIPLATLCALLTLAAGSAQATVTHEFLSGPSARLNQGVPAVGPHGEAIPVPGPFHETRALAVDAGALYVGEGQETSRIDRFDDASGAFLSQLPQLASPEYLHQGLVVGHSTGEAQLYVGGDVRPAGSPLGAVAVLSPAGAHLATWTGADTPAKAFACFECEELASSIAVDDSSSLSDSAAGDVYVVDPRNKVVDVFKPEAGGGEKYLTQLTGPEPPTMLFHEPRFVAVNQSSGTVFVAEREFENPNSEREVENPNGNIVSIFKPAPIAGQYEYAGKLPGSGAGGTFAAITALAVDAGNGDIYVGQRAFLDQFNAAGEYQGHLTGPPAEQFTHVSQIAVDPVSHDVYVADKLEIEGDSELDVFGPDTVIPDVLTEPVTNLEPSRAVINGKINPRKAGSASCEFVWGTSTAFGRVAACEPSEVVEGASPVPVHATLAGLQPDTTYYYRLQATNKNGTNPGEPSQDHEFTTPGPGLIASASDVASTSATLDATVNPHNHPTSYYFQYGKTTAYESQIPSAPGAPLGSGEGGLVLSNHIQGLSADTLYHYRVVAVSELEAGNPTTFMGADETFTTHAGGSGLILPDGRQWELVSPPDKHGATINPISPIGSVIKSSLSGDAVTYDSVVPPESDPMGYVNEAQTFSVRDGGHWSSRDISLPHRSPANPPLGFGAEYKFFSEDLSQAFVRPWGEFTSLAPQSFPPDTESTPYIRHDFTCVTEPATCFQPLVTGAPGYADVPPGTKFGGELPNEEKAIGFEGASPDLSHVVLSSTVALTSTPVVGGKAEGGWLYEWSADKPPSEELRLVSVLPQDEGGAGTEGEFGNREGVGGTGEGARGAVSNDGSRVVWSTSEGLYLRDVNKGVSLRLDAVQPGASGKGSPVPHFQIANSDASIVFFTESRRLTEDSGAVGGEGGSNHDGEPDLYECEIVEVAGALQCKLSDLTPLHSGNKADVLGAVLGASKDGSYVYYVASGALTSVENAHHEQALPGASNLYMRHRNVTSGEWESARLVAVLSGEDRNDWSPHAVKLLRQTTRVSHDGRYLAFMSNRSLTGYDTRDAVSGHPDEEVYLFDQHTERVVCASCDPTGARPHGVEITRLGRTLVNSGEVWEAGSWLAANIPGWTPDEETFLPHYQSRYLSDEGRLFFNTSDALVQQDINGTEDVYEYEPEGIGNCENTSPTFSARSGGCVRLISSGTAAGESAFLDASESGNDVFFLTGEKLVSQDIDTSLDVYDAHVCTTQSPCASASAASPPCTTADACRLAPTPQPAIFGPSGSETFAGSGNVTPTAPGHAGKPKTLTRAQKLARAMSLCRKKKRRRERATCKRQARKRYGAQRPRKSNATKRSNG